MYIYYGQDDFSLVQSLERMKSKIGDQETLATNTTTFDGQQLTVDELRSVCESAPFLAKNRLVIVKGLMGRFEPRRRARGQRKTDNQQDGHQKLGGYVVTIPDSTILVLVDGEIRSSNPLLKMLLGKAEVKSFPLMRGAKLKQWIQRQVVEEGANISTQAVDLMASLVGSNLWIMSSEIGRLTLFASGRRIEKEDVEKVVSYAQEVSVFNLVDAVVEFRARVAERLLRHLLQRGASPAYLLVMLSRQLRLIVRAKELRRQRVSESELRKRLGITQDFVLRKTLEQASRYTLPRLKQVYRQLLETDVAIKTGKYDGELALNILIAELCQQRKVEATGAF